MSGDVVRSMPALPDDIDPTSIRARRWFQGAIRRRDGWKRDEMPHRQADYLAGWDAADALYAEIARSGA